MTSAIRKHLQTYLDKWLLSFLVFCVLGLFLTDRAAIAVPLWWLWIWLFPINFSRPEYMWRNLMLIGVSFVAYGFGIGIWDFLTGPGAFQPNEMQLFVIYLGWNMLITAGLLVWGAYHGAARLINVVVKRGRGQQPQEQPA